MLVVVEMPLGIIAGTIITAPPVIAFQARVCCNVAWFTICASIDNLRAGTSSALEVLVEEKLRAFYLVLAAHFSNYPSTVRSAPHPRV
jgi:hypothetical protein